MKATERSAASDEELFELVQQDNERQAFQELYQRYSRRVFSYCLRAMDTREDAEDVFQTVVMNIYAKRDSFKGGSFVAWLMTITRNQCLMGKRNKRITRDIDEMVDVLESSNNEAKQDFALNEAVRESIAALPEEFREAVEMKYFDDFSYEQIAKATGASLSLVKVRLFRAKKMLLKMMTPYRENFL